MRSLALLLLSAAVAIGCDRPQTQQWSPSDHDQIDRPKQPPARPPIASITPSASQPSPTNPDTVWTSNCAKCHGVDGRADTPAGRAMRVPSLVGTKRTDEELADVITKGSGSMPASNLPAQSVASLIAKIRSLH